MDMPPVTGAGEMSSGHHRAGSKLHQRNLSSQLQLAGLEGHDALVTDKEDIE
jgi:hypothetical protein